MAIVEDNEEGAGTREGIKTQSKSGGDREGFQKSNVHCAMLVIFVHRCTKNLGSILYIDVEKCRQYTLHRCQKCFDVGSILYIDAQKCRQYTLLKWEGLAWVRHTVQSLPKVKWLLRE